MNKKEAPMSPAQAICLAEYVQHAAGSIVSRALVQKPVGSITRSVEIRRSLQISRISAFNLPQTILKLPPENQE